MLYTDCLRLDLYSVGVIIYKMFTGIFPLEAKINEVNTSNKKEVNSEEVQKNLNFTEIINKLDQMSYRHNDSFRTLSLEAQLIIFSNIFS